MSRTTKYFIFLLIVIVTVGFDQTTKHFAKINLSEAPPLDYWDGLFKFIYAENTGAFMGMGGQLSPLAKYLFLIFLPTFLLFVFAASYLRISKTVPQLLAVSLIVAGGTGNMIDRVLNGFVVDFMNLSYGNLRTGIFNVADVAISMGLVLLLYQVMTGWKGQGKEST